METRANHLLIGSFVLVVVVAVFVFVIWLARVEVSGASAYYDVFFEESVTGLTVGGEVRYRGIKVGKVVDIRVKEDDPRRAAVRIEIDPGVVIREGDEATLKIFGITGVAFINVEGASAASPRLVAREGQELPVIPSQPSDFEQLLQGIPELIAQVRELTVRLADLANADNRVAFGDILQNVKVLTETVSETRPQLESIIDSIERASGDIAATAASINALTSKADGLLSNADALMANDVTALVADLRSATRRFDALAVQANELLAENKEPLREFTSDGLNEFARFLTEARLLVAGLSRVTERVEAQGARFFFRDQGTDFRPE